MRYAILIITFLLIISGCGGEKTPIECTTSSDCSAGTCMNVQCINNQCVESTKPDCCGNRICEDSENRCSCGKDCLPACEGTVNVTNSLGKEVTADYLEYACSDDVCSVQIKEGISKTLSLVDQPVFAFFSWSVTTTFDEPFNRDRSSFIVELKLKDDADGLILPIKISEMRLLENELLIGKKTLNKQLSQVGSTITETIPITYSMDQAEETKTIALQIDYEFKRLVSDVPKTVRDTYKKTFTKKIVFVNPGAS